LKEDLSVSVQIHINGDSAAEALQELREFATPLFGAVAPAAVTTETPKSTGKRGANKPSEPAKPDTSGGAAEASDPAPNDKAAGGAAQGAEEPGEGAHQDDDGPVPTIVEIRAKASEAGGKSGGREKVKALLDKFEVPNVSSVPENKRIAFMRELNDVLAKLEEKD
jgi:hypothetical protein